mgnify:CR=1 FL=1
MCNAVYTDTGEYPFKKSAIYTKKMTTSSGRTVEVKIGVAGATYKSRFHHRRSEVGAGRLVHTRYIFECPVRAWECFVGVGADNSIHIGKLGEKMTTSSGRTVEVKIGVAGATYKSFSGRRYRYGGFLDGL